MMHVSNDVDLIHNVCSCIFNLLIHFLIYDAYLEAAIVAILRSILKCHCE